MKPVVVVLTPSIDLARYDISSTNTPGARYSGMAVSLRADDERGVRRRRAQHELASVLDRRLADLRWWGRRRYERRQRLVEEHAEIGQLTGPRQRDVRHEGLQRHRPRRLCKRSLG